MVKKVDDATFIEAWRRLCTPTLVAKELGLHERATLSRRTAMEAKYGISLPTKTTRAKPRGTTAQRAAVEKLSQERATHIEHEISLSVEDGVVVIFSDAHYWPGIVTPAHVALLEVCRRLKPALVVANGDVLDGATISRHPRMGWEQRPTVAQEVETLCLRMREIEKASAGAKLIRTMGNHDSRFENYIAANAPALEGVHGTSLFDFLPNWRGSLAVFRLRKKTIA